MKYVYNTKGTCSVRTEVELNGDHTIAEVRVLGGCNGNLKGISSLLVGMKAEDAIARMEGTTCGNKTASIIRWIPRHCCVKSGACAGNCWRKIPIRCIKKLPFWAVPPPMRWPTSWDCFCCNTALKRSFIKVSTLNIGRTPCSARRNWMPLLRM